MFYWVFVLQLSLFCLFSVFGRVFSLRWFIWTHGFDKDYVFVFFGSSTSGHSKSQTYLIVHLFTRFVIYWVTNFPIHWKTCLFIIYQISDLPTAALVCLPSYLIGSHRMCVCVCQRLCQRRMHAHMDGSMNRGRDGCMDDGRIHTCRLKRMMDAWMYGFMDVWTYRYMYDYVCTFLPRSSPHLCSYSCQLQP